MKKALTIAGSDSSGGAGIQADLKTFMAHNIYGMSVITAITAQNTCGVYGIENISAGIVEAQLDAVFADIFPDSVKTGMLPSPEIINIVAEKLVKYGARNIVLDPVMVSTSGCDLIDKTAADALKDILMPVADIVTPNISEAEVLCGFSIPCREAMTDAAFALARQCGKAVLIKGGHLAGYADDLLVSGGKAIWFKGKKINTKNTHGTGCTLSSAIAANLAAGLTILESVGKGKQFVYEALKSGIDTGKGCGPLNHLYRNVFHDQ